VSEEGTGPLDPANPTGDVRHGYPTQGHPQPGHSAQGYPQHAYPTPGYPAQGSAAPIGCYPSQGYPTQGYPAPGPGNSGVAAEYPQASYGWGAMSAPQPGSIPLRPLNVGDLFNGAFAAIRANPGVMIGFTAVIVVLSQLVTFLAQISLDNVSVESTRGAGTSIIAFYGVSIGVSLIPMLATTILTGMLTVVVARSVLGDRTDAGSAWRSLIPRLMPLIGLVLVQTVIYLIPTGVLVAMLILLLAGAGSWGASAFAAILALVLMVVLIAGLMPAFALATAAVILEGRGPFNALSRGFQLQRPGYWRLVGIMLLTYLVTWFVSGVISIPFSVGAIASTDVGDLGPLTGSSVLGLGLTAIAGTISGIFTMPFTSSVNTLLYADQRMRTERFDGVLQSAAAYQAQTGQSAASQVWVSQRP
jgi:hypothetical protein